MKKSYTCPSILPNGSVGSRTESGTTAGSELAQPLLQYTM